MKKYLLLIVLLVGFLCFPAVTFADEKNDSQKIPSGISLEELEQFIDDYMAENVGSEIAGARVIVAKNGETLLNKVYGYADIENGIPVDDDTVFDWASISKLLAWTSAMQLAEQGRLDLNADIRGYLPEGFFKRLKYDTPITMFNLMHHNAGWSARLTDPMVLSPENVLALEETLRRFEPNQVFEPGTVNNYSNYGTAVAGFIIERISGQPYYEYVNENIFSVLGMNDTALHPYQADNPSISGRRDAVKTYIPNGGVLTPSPFGRMYFSDYPCGSAVGTAADMAKFLAALTPAEGTKSPLFKNESTLKEMQTVSYSYGAGIPGMAHGFFEESFSVRTLMHSGNLPAAASRLTFAPDSGFGFVIMTNTANQAVGSDIAAVMFGKSAPDVYSGTLPDARELSNLEGQYRGILIEYRGFLQLFGAMPKPQDVIVIIDENTVSLGETEYTQIRPYVFRNDTEALTLHLIVENGDVKRVLLVSDTAAVMTAGAVLEYTPVSALRVFASSISLLLFVVCIFFIIAAFFITIIGAIRNRRKGVPSNLVKKLNMALILVGLAVLFNYLVMIIRAGFLTPQSALLPHFIFNIVYIVFAPICSYFIFRNMKKTELSKGDKLFCVLSCVFSVALAALMIAWEFYR